MPQNLLGTSEELNPPRAQRKPLAHEKSVSVSSDLPTPADWRARAVQSISSCNGESQAPEVPLGRGRSSRHTQSQGHPRAGPQPRRELGETIRSMKATKGIPAAPNLKSHLRNWSWKSQHLGGRDRKNKKTKPKKGPKATILSFWISL